MLVFEERGNRSTRRKPLGAEKRTNKLNPHLTPDLGIEPGPHWWEASALTTAPSLCRQGVFFFNGFRIWHSTSLGYRDYLVIVSDWRILIKLFTLKLATVLSDSETAMIWQCCEVHCQRSNTILICLDFKTGHQC